MGAQVGGQGRAATRIPGRQVHFKTLSGPDGTQMTAPWKRPVAKVGGGGKAPPQKHVKHNHQKAKGYKCLYFSPHSMAVEFPQARGRRQLAHHFPQHDLCPICVLITTWVAGINAGSGTTRNL